MLLLLPAGAGAGGAAAASPPAQLACLLQPEGSAAEAPKDGQQSDQAPGLQGGAHAHADKEGGGGAEIGGVGVDPGDEKENGGAGRANVDMCGEAGVGMGASGNAGCTDGASAHKKGGKKGGAGAGGKRRAN